MFNKNRASFGELFFRHIQCSLTAAEALHSFVADPVAGRPRFEKILELEHKGDVIVRQTHELLDRTYIADFDKSDIERLITKLDDVLDGIKTVAKRIHDYNITEMLAPAREIVTIILAMIVSLQNLIQSISALKSSQLQLAIQAIHAYEEAVDDHLSTVLATLYQDKAVDAKKFIALQEIFQRLERITDRCEDVADVLSSIARKEAR